MINLVLFSSLSTIGYHLQLINFNLSYAYGKGMVSQENVNISFHNESK
jgi:hypothetical protein